MSVGAALSGVSPLMERAASLLIAGELSLAIFSEYGRMSMFARWRARYAVRRMSSLLLSSRLMHLSSPSLPRCGSIQMARAAIHWLGWLSSFSTDESDDAPPATSPLNPEKRTLTAGLFRAAICPAVVLKSIAGIFDLYPLGAIL